MKRKNIKNFKKVPSVTDKKKAISDSEITGFLVIFDITSSTSLKKVRDFPNWVFDWEYAYETIVTPFFNLGVKWYKFLGDAFLFFFPDEPKKCPPSLIQLNPATIFDTCNKIMDKCWNDNKKYRRNKKGSEKNIEFREITCALDYGNQILNWYSVVDSGKSMFDPLGPTVDRCFRISSITASSQFLMSVECKEKLSKVKPNITEQLLKINLATELKGLKDEKTVYYVLPNKEKMDYILHDYNVELVETIPPLAIKEKLHLFRYNRKK